MNNLLKNAKNYILNLKGYTTDKKIIVFQSDDWGSIRSPSSLTRKVLQNYPEMEVNGTFAKYDTLASPEDLEALFEVLNSVRDKNNNPALLTANCLMANPDFEKIYENNFESYEYEHIEQTFRRYNNTDALKLWHEGLNSEIFVPQFHGREHVNFNFWLTTIKEKNEAVREAFYNKTFGASFKNLKHNQTNFQRAWDTTLTTNKETLNDSLIDGLNLFKEFFGYASLSVVAPNYTWNPEHESLLRSQGVLAIQGILNQRVSKSYNEQYTYKKRFTEQSKSKNNLDYQRRNVFFEPSNRPNPNIVENAIKRIDISFKTKKPAIIGTHRVNFIGGLDEENRTKNLLLFKKLLDKIVKTWPDVIFMSASDLALEMNKKHYD